MFIDFSTGLPDCLMGTPSANLVDLWGGGVAYIYIYIYIYVDIRICQDMSRWLLKCRGLSSSTSRYTCILAARGVWDEP